MSLLVFPSFPTSQWDIAFPIKQSPRYNTIIQTAASGRGEIRIPTMQFPLWDFSFPIQYLRGDMWGTGTAWQNFVNFLMGVQGQAADWLFLHPYDSYVGSYTVTGALTGAFVTRERVVQNSTGASAQLIGSTSTLMTISFYTSGSPDNSHVWVGQTSGATFTPSATPALASSQAFATGDGATTAFTMFRTLITSGAQDMIQNFVNPPNIYDNGSLVNPANYTIDQYGTITFTVAPVAAHTIAWAGQFYYRCRFLEDFWDSLQEDYRGFWSLSELKFRSVLL